MFYSQEQYDEAQEELLGDGFSNDMQRASFIFRMERPLRNERPEAELRTRLGKHVVMDSHAVYGPCDEIIGDDHVIVGTFDTRAEAEELLARYDDQDVCGEFSHWIFELPAPKPVVIDEALETDDACPF